MAIDNNDYKKISESGFAAAKAFRELNRGLLIIQLASPAKKEKQVYFCKNEITKKRAEILCVKIDKYSKRAMKLHLKYFIKKCYKSKKYDKKLEKLRKNLSKIVLIKRNISSWVDLGVKR